MTVRLTARLTARPASSWFRHQCSGHAEKGCSVLARCPHGDATTHRHSAVRPRPDWGMDAKEP
jgi:hypothetical protein